jgi:tRNA pseudouridine55 synthase
MSIKYRNKDLHGVLNVYKEKDFTSHDVVAVVRKITGAKTGHTGTLDPDAEGVLPVCLGKATRLSDYLMADQKEYHAELILGKTTDTQDASGTVLSERIVTVSCSEVEELLNSFVGDIMQTPPMYSAIKIDGKKLYELARQGKEIERKQRQIHIESIKITDNSAPNRYQIDVTCSKGTYIRALCADIGEKLGCGAHMGALLRVRTGRFVLSDSLRLAEIKANVESGQINDILMPLEAVLKPYKKVVIAESENKYLYNGNKIHIKNAVFEDKIPEQNAIYTVYDSENQLIGLYELILLNRELYLKPKTMLLS